MMAGRPHSAERIADLAGDDLVDRVGGAADGAQRRLPRARRHGRVGVDAHQALLGRRLLDGVDEGFRMNPHDRLAAAARRLAPVEQREALRLEGRLDGAQPVGALRMAGWREVIEAGGMSDEKRLHEAPARYCRNR